MCTASFMSSRQDLLNCFQFPFFQFYKSVISVSYSITNLFGPELIQDAIGRASKRVGGGFTPNFTA